MDQPTFLACKWIKYTCWTPNVIEAEIWKNILQHIYRHVFEVTEQFNLLTKVQTHIIQSIIF